MRRLVLLLIASGIGLARCGGTSLRGPTTVRTPPARPPPRHYDWIGVIGTGQSLSVGACGRPVLGERQRYGNLKLADLEERYPRDGGGSLLLVPLAEPIRPYWAGGDGQYPNNILGETPHTSLGDELTALSLARGGPPTVSVHSVVGWSAHCMRDLDKEGPGIAYPASLSEARTIAQMARVENTSFAYAGVVLTHGECDSPSPTYEDDLYRLWQNYDRDLRAITGQPEPIVLFVSQQHSFPGDRSVPLSTLAVWRAGRDHPGEIVCTGPKYQYGYFPDNVHFAAASYQRLGEKYAEVMDRVFVQHQSWAPLGPHDARRDGNTITIDFEVPDPPLSWDETLEAPHQAVLTEWAKGRGFEVESGGQRVPIAGARIVGDAVVLDLGASRSGPLTVRYAMTQDGEGLYAGTPLGRRGQLCDSDALVGVDAETIECVVEHGSHSVVGALHAFDTRAKRDIVEGAGLPAGTVLERIEDGSRAALSSPWTGVSGTAALRLRHDQRNYAVAFELIVP